MKLKHRNLIAMALAAVGLLLLPLLLQFLLPLDIRQLLLKL